jgi:hypothetical protein
LIDSYEAGDKRLDASVAVAEGNYDASGAFVASSVQSIIGYTTPPGKVSKLFIKKYLHPPYATPGQTGDNWPVYRYSEALLSLAECLNEAGKSAEALSYLNQVRVRAGLAPSIEENQNTLRDIIFQERRIELAFENKRWLDLVRTGKAISVMTAFGNKVKSQDSRIPASAYNVTNDRLLFPFPLTEVQVNPQIIQNPGYN